MIGFAKTLKLSFAIGALLLFCSSLLTVYNANRWSSEGRAVAQARAILSFIALIFAGWRSHYDFVRRQGAERSLGVVERRFDAFMRFNPCIAFIKDSQGRMVFVNAALEKAFNIRLADWQDRDDFSLWPRHIAEALRATDLKVLAGDSTLEVIETVITPDGAPRDFLSVKFPFSVQGSERFIGGLAFDIAERRTAELALQESEKFNRSILESSQDCIKILSLEGDLLFINSGGQKQLGICNLDPLLNTCWLDFWSGEYRPEAAQAIAAAASGHVGRFEGFCATFTGEPKWWHVIISPIPDSAGNPQRLLCISRDITVLKLADKKVAESEARYRKLFDRNPLPAWIYCTETFRFLDANQSAAEHYGYSRSEFLQLRVSDIRVPAQMHLIEQDLSQAIASNRRPPCRLVR